MSNNFKTFGGSKLKDLNMIDKKQIHGA